MSAEIISERINATPTLKAGSLRFWGDWFGKPYDNCHTISRCTAQDRVLLIEFEDGGKLTVTDPDGLMLGADEFAIHVASSVRWEWLYYGRPQLLENPYFLEYTRRGSNIEAATNVDWYQLNLSPNPSESAVAIL